MNLPKTLKSSPQGTVSSKIISLWEFTITHWKSAVSCIRMERNKSVDVTWHYSWGDKNKQLLTPNRKPKTDQITDTTKVQLDESMSFIRVTYTNMTGVTYWRTKEWKTTASPKLPSAQVTVQESQKPWAHWTIFRHLNRVQNVFLVKSGGPSQFQGA